MSGALVGHNRGRFKLLAQPLAKFGSWELKFTYPLPLQAGAPAGTRTNNHG